MARRVLGPVGGAVIFCGVAALVFAGLGWVTVAGLRVEEAQREAAAQAALSGNLRVALLRLDARMLPALSGEDIRPYYHYAGDSTTTQPEPSPLLEAGLPPWMRLHFQIDPDADWDSPQVPPAEAMDYFRLTCPPTALVNATPDRRDLLATCQTRFPARQVADVLSGRDRPVPSDGAVPSPSPLPPVPGGAATGVTTNEAKDFRPPPAPGAGAGASPAEDGTRFGLAAPKAAEAARFYFYGVEVPLPDRSLGRKSDSALRRANAGPEPTDPSAGQPPAPRSMPAPEPAVPAPPPYRFQTPSQVPAEPAPAGGVAAAPRAGNRMGNDPDNVFDKSLEEARQAGKLGSQYQMGRGSTYAPGSNPGAAGNSAQNANGATRNAPVAGLPLGAKLKEMMKTAPLAHPEDKPSGAAGPPATPAAPPAASSGPGGSAPPTRPGEGVAGRSGLAKEEARPTGGRPGGFGGTGGGGMGGGAMPGGGGGYGGPGAVPGPKADGGPAANKKRTETFAEKGASDGKAATPGRGVSLGTEADKTADKTAGKPLTPATDGETLAFRALGIIRFKDVAEHLDALRKQVTEELGKGDEQRRLAEREKKEKQGLADERKSGERGSAKFAGGERDGVTLADRMAEKESVAKAPETAGRDAPAAGGLKAEAVPAPAAAPPLPGPIAVHLGSMHPQWLTAADGSDTLVLVRVAKLTRPGAEPRTVYQGVVLDWPRLEEDLREVVKDVFPDAKLAPAKDPEGVPVDRAMRTLPVQLDPGPSAAAAPPTWTPLRIGLVLAWAAAVIAFAAVGLSGWSLIDLAERRIRFVSAVTHELRTPLTSLRLYLDMLVSGMVQDEKKREEYLATLNTESDRLHRLIDNVLDYARLERRRTRADSQKVLVGDLLEVLRETWVDRCGTDGKELVVISTLPTEQEVCTDRHLVGQIVGNLIDNARKYTRDAADPRIWVWAKPVGRRWVVFEVEDRGPGVPAGERRSIFRPFRRGDAADTRAGGAGLGLALAKQWAEALGGRLTYRPADGGTGACFRLELRVR